MQTQIEFSAELQNYIDRILQERLLDSIAKFVHDNEIRLKELSILERIVRVEEELKHLTEEQKKDRDYLVNLINTRFEALQKDMNARFEAMNTRFEALQKDMNTRFEALQKDMNTRFEAMNTRFEALQKDMNTRFEAMNARFEALQQQMHERFSSLEKRFQFMQWMIAVGLTVVAIVTGFK